MTEPADLLAVKPAHAEQDSDAALAEISIPYLERLIIFDTICSDSDSPDHRQKLSVGQPWMVTDSSRQSVLISC